MRKLFLIANIAACVAEKENEEASLVNQLSHLASHLRHTQLFTNIDCLFERSDVYKNFCFSFRSFLSFLLQHPFAPLLHHTSLPFVSFAAFFPQVFTQLFLTTSANLLRILSLSLRLSLSSFSYRSFWGERRVMRSHTTRRVHASLGSPYGTYDEL